MDLFDGLTLVGGLSLFLFGMSIMGQALERRAGEKLRALLGRLTTNRCDPKFVGSHRYGGRFCQLRSHDIKAGCKCDHGSEYRNDCYSMAFKPCRN